MTNTNNTNKYHRNIIHIIITTIRMMITLLINFYHSGYTNDDININNNDNSN